MLARSRIVPVRRTLALRRDGLTQIAIVLAALGAYEGARMLMVPNWPEAFSNARKVLHIERVAGFAWEDSLQQVFLQMPSLIQALNVFYFVGHFVLTGIFFVWLYHRSRDGFRLFRDAFLVATALSLLVHWWFPTAPPRLAGIGLEDTLRALSGIDIGSPQSSALSNPVAAVPSLHAAYALGVSAGLLMFGRLLAVRIAGVLYPPLVVLTIVVTGNHFFFDALAGTVVLAAGFLVAWRLRSGRSQQSGRPSPACLT
jgi:membrane-associated phospholipid phosphatase